MRSDQERWLRAQVPRVLDVPQGDVPVVGNCSAPTECRELCIGSDRFDMFLGLRVAFKVLGTDLGCGLVPWHLLALSKGPNVNLQVF